MKQPKGWSVTVNRYANFIQVASLIVSDLSHYEQGTAMLINPKLPKHFFDCDHSLRSVTEIKKFWEVPIIITEQYSPDTYIKYTERIAMNSCSPKISEAEFNAFEESCKQSWFTHFPTGTAYRVYYLCDGAWDRPLEWGSFGTLNQAKSCCESGQYWLQSQSKPKPES